MSSDADDGHATHEANSHEPVNRATSLVSAEEHHAPRLPPIVRNPTSKSDWAGADNGTGNAAMDARLKDIKHKMASLTDDTYGLDAAALGELCNFDRRTNPTQVASLENEYGGVAGVALLLRSDVNSGINRRIGGHEHRGSKSGRVHPEAKQHEGGPGTVDMTATDAARRKERFGANMIPPPRSETIFEIVWGTIKEDPIIKILLVGAIVVLALGTAMCPADGWLDGLVILVAVALVLSVTAGNDYLKDKKFKKLLLLQSDKKVKVVRGGIKDEISSWDVHVGDVVELVTGDEVPADGIFISGNRLVIDESPLTGESIPVKKSSQAPFMFSGCQVSEGSGRMLVTGVGVKSSGGQIQELLNEAQNEETVLQRKLKVVAVLIGKIGVAAGIATFLGLAIRWAIGWAQGESVWNDCSKTFGSSTIQRVQMIVNDFVIGITVVVVAVPEGLPLAVTISLAFSMFKMMKDNCFVRHLDASETMGEATCICTDKTGTLTENKMTVVKALVGDKLYYGEGSGEANSAPFSRSTFDEKIRDLLVENMCLNSDCFIKIHEEKGTDVFIGSATEGAMLVLSRNMGFEYDSLRNSITKVSGGVWSFSSDRKRMSTLVVSQAFSPSLTEAGANGKKAYRLYSKGASEIILSLCTHMLDYSGSSAAPMSDVIRGKIQRIIQRWASEGLRTLGLAYRDTDQKLTTLDMSRGDDPEHDLVWIGLIGIKDPLRREVPGAVAICQKAGLTVRMVTGDNILTACKISRECGILYGDKVALEGPVFRSMSRDEKVKVIPKLAVLARSSPADKHTLVSLLKEMGEVVSVTGDGTNDAPALKEADVGFAMGIAGTQIARNASDIILLDDNFVSLVQSIRWGRNVLNSVRKFLQFQLGVNLVAIVLTFVGSVTSGSSPLNTVQLLWVNLIMDSLGALALASDDPDDDILNHPPHRRTESLLSKDMMIYICTQLVYQIVVLMTVLLKIDSLLPPDLTFHGIEDMTSTSGDNGPSKRAITMVFTIFIFLQVANEIMARQLNGELNIFAKFFKNKMFLLIVIVILVVQTICIVFIGSFFSTCPMDWREWVTCIVLSAGNLLFTFVVRLLVKVYVKPKATEGTTSLAITAGPASENVTSPAAVAEGKVPGPVNAWSTTELEAGKGGHRRQSRWTTVRSAVVLIGGLQDVQKEGFTATGPDEEFISTWMRFRKDVKFTTKSGALRASQNSLKKL